mmetsp:Transcript_25216/g.40923  ORF Transcript_25216/g.40923 Transcript_25216/m.40923 type:complete len:399 (+) Transcript_25216:2-1198(+)
MGLGVYMMKQGEETYNAVKWALDAGYRMIDTAAIYHNEESVGKAIAESGVSRGEIFLATKLWDSDHGYDATIQGLETSLAKLKVEYLDLYLIHSPNTGKLVETWDALIHMQKQGKIRSIGVSNFGVQHLEALKEHGRPMPTVNQIEMHPMKYQERIPLLDFCKQNGILVQAYGSLFFGKPEFLERSEVTDIVNAHSSSSAHVLLRWALQMGFQIIPKSVKQQRIAENLKVFDLELSPAEMESLSAMEGPVDADTLLEKQRSSFASWRGQRMAAEQRRRELQLELMGIASSLQAPEGMKPVPPLFQPSGAPEVKNATLYRELYKQKQMHLAAMRELVAATNQQIQEREAELDEEFDVLLGSGLPKLLTALKTEGIIRHDLRHLKEDPDRAARLRASLLK